VWARGAALQFPTHTELRYTFAMRSTGASIAKDGEPIRIDFAPDHVHMYWVQNVGIMAWYKPVTAPVLEALHNQTQARRAQYPSGMSFVHVGRAEMALIDSATRQMFVRTARDLDGYTAATAILTRASGFLASTLRSVATGILVLARTDVELRINERPEEVIEWLPARHEAVTGLKLDVDHLLRVLNTAAHCLGNPAEPAALR
jgi:hypothetical protein